MNLKPLKSSFIFRFVDDVTSSGLFEKGSPSSGIIMKASFDESAKMPRWVNVLAVGPDCEGIVAGDVVLLPNLRWTEHFKHDGEKYWRSEEKEIVAKQTMEGKNMDAVGEFVIFLKRAVPKPEGTSLIIMSGLGETPHGIAVKVGPKVTDMTVGVKMYYDGTNFSNDFEMQGLKFSFIKESEVILVVDNI